MSTDSKGIGPRDEDGLPIYEREPDEVPPPQPAPDAIVTGALASVDPAAEIGRGSVREGMRKWPKRWRGIDADAKDEYSKGLLVAAKAARALVEANAGDAELGEGNVANLIAGINATASIVRTAVAMEGQVQTDEHLADKNARIDSGKATELHEFQAGVVNRLPLPSSLDDAK